MNSITFVTGNDEKVRDAQFALKRYGVKVVKRECDIDEIQHHEPVNIALAKAKGAYDLLQCPLVVNDSSWSIPALGGFPGGYMKDVTAWLATKDFLALMKDKDNKQIFLHEVVVYIDEKGPQVFEALREGLFVDEPAGKNDPSFARIVKMEGDDVTISQIFDEDGERNLDPQRYEHWNKFGEWYSSSNE